ncbi:MAG: AAA family ATPase, partial [Chloroflexi bacterium]|nr:AAA family ATPase [Chloroflexota bacterium]
MRCASCGTDNPFGAKFCHQCGDRLGQVCPSCSFSNLLEARFCNDCGTRIAVDQPVVAIATASSSPAELSRLDEEERRPVSLLFADLVGFTALAERLDPEDAREVTNIALGRLAREVTVYGGTVDKFIGDALLALFGAPIAHEDDAERAISAALAMLRAVEELNETHATIGAGKLAIRLGVNTGLVVVGAREMGGRQEYTAIGDAVNVAARLQAAAEPSTILVGEASYRATSNRFAFEALPPLQLRGRADPVAAFKVLGRAESRLEPRPAASEAHPSPMIGRSAELGSLRYCLDELSRGRGQIAFVLGEAGLGKTRLVGELRRQTEPGASWAQARALSYGQNLTYGMFNGTIRGMFPADSLGAEGASERLTAYLRDLHAEVAYPFLAYQLGLPVEPAVQTELEGLSPRELHARLLTSMRVWLSAVALRSPLVVELDDVHWADPSSLELLDGWLDLADQIPIFFCFVMRPERASRAWQIKERAARSFPHRYTEINLSPLDELESLEMIGSLLGGAELRPGLQAQVLVKTEGNPFFIEEVVRGLAERGALGDMAGPNSWGDTSSIALPDSLQSAIVARIDRLHESVRRVLQTAAVIGRSFQYSILETVLAGHAGLDDDLREAERADLIREVAVYPVREYSFKHLLVQEAAYNTLLVRRRRELHQVVAQAIESLYPERLEEFYDVLTHHWSEAERWEQALLYAEREGDRAAASHANQEALEHYSLALRAAGAREGPADPAWLAALHEKRGDVQAVLAESDGAVRSFQESLALWAAAGVADRETRGRLGLKLARVAMARQDSSSLSAYLSSVLDSLAPEDPLLASAWSLKAWEQVWWTDYGGAAESADRAMSLARAAGAAEQVDEAYAALTHPSVAALPGRDFRRLCHDWLTEAEGRGDQLAVFNALTASVLNQVWVSGTFDAAALGRARRALALTQDLGSPPAESRARVILGSGLYLAGDWTEAYSQMLVVTDDRRSTGRTEEWRTFWLGRLLTMVGDFDQAVEMLQRGLEMPGFPHSR